MVRKNNNSSIVAYESKLLRNALNKLRGNPYLSEKGKKEINNLIKEAKKLFKILLWMPQNN